MLAATLILLFAMQAPAVSTTAGAAVSAVERAEARGGPRRPSKRPPKAPARKRAPPPPPRGPLEVPIDVGLGPVLLWGNPPVGTDQLAHFALGIEAAAVVDQALIRRFERQIPPGLRRQAQALGEVRVRPWWLALVPELLVVSPQIWNTGMYGAVWRPFGVGLTFLDKPVRVSTNAALDLAYLFIHSRTLPEPTHFLRPGVNLKLDVEVPLSETLLVSTGWSSDLFVPQPLGGSPLEVLPLDAALWHLGGPYLLLHYRFPLELSL